MKNRNAFRVFLTFVLVLAVAVPFLTSTRRVSAITGAIYTSRADGTTVNANIYDNCCDVYLNGGPSNCNGGSGLDTGDYYFQVTNPNTNDLLSTDDASERIVRVTNGVITDYLGASGAGAPGTCVHEKAQGHCGPGSWEVQLMPFSMTPNPGGEYKVEVVPVGAATVDLDGKHLNFSNNDSKSDNFKCKMSGGTPQSAIGGVKYYDTNANGMFD